MLQDQSLPASLDVFTAEGSKRTNRAQAECVECGAELFVHRHEGEWCWREIRRVVIGRDDVHECAVATLSFEARAGPRRCTGGDA